MGTTAAIEPKLRLKEVLEQREIGQRELARKAGLSHATICQWISGRNQGATFTSLAKIARVLGCKIEDLVEY